MSSVTSADGTSLTVETSGSADGPLVVLVHGLGLTTKSRGRVPQLLAGQHRIVAYDLRGNGRSARATTKDYRLSTHAEDLAAVLDEVVPAGGGAVLVGHSLGGAIITLGKEVTPQDVERLMQALPDGELVDLAGVGHMVPLARADEVARHVARWVARCA